MIFNAMLLVELEHIFLYLFYRIMQREGLNDAIRKTEFYSKPCDERNRVDRARAKRLYGASMASKVKFLMRKSRPNPHPR